MNNDNHVPPWAWLRIISAVLWFSVTLNFGFDETVAPMTVILVICWIIAAIIQGNDIAEKQKEANERARQRAQDLNDILWNGKDGLETRLQRDREEFERKHGYPISELRNRFNDKNSDKK